MIDPKRFQRMKEMYGDCGSWAVWAAEGQRPKDNIGDLSIFDTTANPGLLQQLNPGVVLVGLNLSRGVISVPWANFHDPRPQAMDFKIRYALKETALWGAYMTDIIKYVEQKTAGKLRGYLRANPDVEKENIRRFRQELHELGAANPVLVAFGNLTQAILTRNMKGECTILKLPHYSMHVGKETYRETAERLINTEFLQLGHLTVKKHGG